MLFAYSKELDTHLKKRGVDVVSSCSRENEEKICRGKVIVKVYHPVLVLQ